MDHLNAPTLQIFAVSSQPGQISRIKSYLITERLHQLHLHHGGMAAGIAIRAGRLVVDEQGTAHVAAIFDAISQGKIRLAVAFEAGLPLVFKQGPVNFLIALHA